MLRKLKELAKRVWANDNVRRVWHTFWQAAGGVLVAGLLAAHSSADVKAAVFLAATTGFSAVKALYISRRVEE